MGSAKSNHIQMGTDLWPVKEVISDSGQVFGPRMTLVSFKLALAASGILLAGIGGLLGYSLKETVSTPCGVVPTIAVAQQRVNGLSPGTPSSSKTTKDIR